MRNMLSGFTRVPIFHLVRAPDILWRGGMQELGGRCCGGSSSPLGNRSSLWQVCRGRWFEGWQCLAGQQVAINVVCESTMLPDV